MTTTAGATGSAAKAAKSPKDAATDELHDAARDLLAAMKAVGLVEKWLEDATVGAAMVRLRAAVVATTPAPTVVDVPHAQQFGDQLTCTMGNWTGEPDSYAYQWKSGGVDVPGAGAAEYTIAAGDTGKTFACVVTASNVGGQATSTSNGVVVVGALGAMGSTGATGTVSRR